MKRILSFLLVFAMILSSSAMVFAQTGDKHSISYYDYRVDPWSDTDEKEWVYLWVEDLKYPKFSYIEGQEPEYLETYMPNTEEKEFQGWYDAPEGGNYVDKISPAWTGDIDLYARWYKKPQLVAASPSEAVNDSKTYNPFITISHEDLANGTASVSFRWYKLATDGGMILLTGASITKENDGTYTSYLFDEAVSGSALFDADAGYCEYRAYATITKTLENGKEYSSYLPRVDICYVSEDVVGSVDGKFYENAWSLLYHINNGSTVELFADVYYPGNYPYGVSSEDVTINANGHSLKNVRINNPITVNNPGGSWELSLDNGNYEDDYFMSSGFVNVNNAAEDASFQISFMQNIENPSGYYFMSGMDASDVSVALSGYTAYNYGEYVGLIESTALPYAVAAERDEEGLITKFEFFASLEEAQWYTEDNTVYVVDYYNTSSGILSNVYDCYNTPGSLELRTLYRTTDGNNTSFYLYSGGAFVEQYNNGEKIEMSDVQKESAATLNCRNYVEQTPTPISFGDVIIKNTWEEVASAGPAGSIGPNLESGGAYYFTNENVVVSKEGKYTFIANGGSVTIAPTSGQDASKISVNVVGELSSLTIAEGVRCAVSAMPGYPKQTRIGYIENNGSLGISGNNSFQTMISKLQNSGVVRTSEDLVITKMDCLSDYTAIKNLNGGKMYIDSLFMDLTGDGKDVKLVAIENRG